MKKLSVFDSGSKKKLSPAFVAVSALMLTACAQQPQGVGFWGATQMVPQNFHQPQFQPQFYQQPQYVQQQPIVHQPMIQQQGEYVDPRTPLERIRDMSGGEDLYNGTISTAREGKTSPEAVSELIRQVEREIEERDGIRSSSSASTGSSNSSSRSAAVAKTIADAEESTRSASENKNDCASGSCPIRSESSKEIKDLRSDVTVETEKKELSETKPNEQTEKAPVTAIPASDLDLAAYSHYIRDMMPHYASENMTGSVETLTYRQALNAGRIFETFRAEHPEMAECQQVKSNAAMIQLQQTYAVLHQKEKEEEQVLSAQIEKARKKAGKIKDLSKREKAFQKELDAIWKNFNSQKLVDYYQGIGIQKDQILMNYKDLNSFIDSIEGCIQDAKKTLGNPS
jgi:hypothetical protein